MNKPVKFTLKVLGILVGVIAVLMCIVMALSPIAKYVINHYGPVIVGREAHVERVFINPLRVASVTLDDFHLKEENGLTDFAAFDRLYADINLMALLHREVDVRQITLTHFSGEIMRSNDRFNFTDIIEHFQTPDSLREEEVDSTSSSPWMVSLRNIDIYESRVEYRDVVREDKWELNDININIPGLYLGGNRRSNAGIRFQFQRGGSVGIQADYTMSTNEYVVRLHLDSVATEVAHPFIKSILAVSALGGSISGDVAATGNLNRPADTRLGGWLSADSISIEDEQGNIPLSFGRFYAALGTVDLATMHLDIDTLFLSGLRAEYCKDADSVNTLMRLRQTASVERIEEEDTLVSDAGTAEVSISRSQPKELYLTARLVQVQDAEVRYIDRSMTPEFSYTISHFGFKAFRLSNHAANHVKFSASVGRTGRLEGQYRGDLDLDKGNQNLDLMLQNVDVAEFSPFTESLMAYPLHGGLLSLRSTTTLSQGNIDSRNRIEIDKMEVGKKMVPSQAPYKAIPLKLGVGLLKSSQGLIVMDLPISGDLHSPKFKFRQIILRALGKVFFGPLMGVADKKELAEWADIVDDPDLHAQIEQSIDSLSNDSARSAE